MKPNFALGLTKDGITLWQRSASGWLRVGAVSTDAPQMDAQMRDLAKVAAALAPEGVRTKLVVPDEQILFCDLQISARNPDMQAHEIRAQLAGRTPYPVEELDFDWTEKNGAAHVAVVARETVIEAEDFASLYGLNPVSVVGASESGRFTQEPFFGTTRSAREILGDPASLERDRDILRETGIVTLPDPELVAADKDKTPPSPQATGKPETTSTAPADTAAKASQAASEKSPAAQPDSAKASASRDTAASAAPTSSTTADDRKAAMMSKLKAAKADSDNAALRKTSDRQTTAFSTRQGSSPTQPQQKEDTSPEAVAFRSRRAATPPANPAKTPLPKTQGPKPGKDLLGALRSRLGSRPGLSKLSFGSFGKALGTPKATVAPENRQASPAHDSDRAVPWKPDAQTTLPKAAAPKSSAAAPAAMQKPSPKPASGKPNPVKAEKAKATGRKDPLDTLRAHGTSGSGQSEVDRMTIFGARNRDEDDASPARRAFLVLGGVAVLLLAVAIWVFYFTASNPEPAPALTEDFSPVVDPAPLVAEQTDPLDSVLAQDDIEAALGLEDAAQQLPMDATGLELADESQSTAQTAPIAAESEMTAGRIAGLRSSALLPPQEAVPLPTPPSAPAPFGAEPLPPLREELEVATAPTPDEDAAAIQADSLTADAAEPDASGLPAGEDALDIAVTPGTPPVTPPTRPEGLAPEPEAAVAPEAALEPEPEQAIADEATPDPLDESALVISVTEGVPPVTPPARPEGLTPEVPASAEPVTEGEADTQIQSPPEEEDESSSADQAQLNTPPPGGVALTTLRPATRPAELAEAVAAATAEPAIDASDLAVAASARPGARPGQFAAVVQRALRAAQPRTETQTSPSVASAPEPQAQAAIQTARAAVPAAPPIPASASVAREATQARAINLRQINLIGVMGTSSSRRALVRLSNGRVVAVRVGEQLDGGQVTAIGENELRYIRRGRDVVLRIAS